MEDEKIIELFFARLEQAVQELDAKYGKLCLYLSENILGNRSDAEECVNDAYLGAWNAIPPAKPDPLKAYICKIFRNISLNLYYKKTALKRSSTYEFVLSEMEDLLPSPDTAEAEIEAEELSHIIEDFLETLPKQNRVIFMQRYWFSDTYADIATRVGINVKNVSVRLTRIRKKMKKYLSEREAFA